MTKIHRTYPVWLHLLHITYHAAIVIDQCVGFISSFQSSDVNKITSDSPGPGWRFRYVTTWILTTLALYMLAALLFDIILILRGLHDSIVKQFKIHIDRSFCVMFSMCAGMGFFFHLLFFIQCAKNAGCPKYTDTLWFIHLMPFWYALGEHFFVPHNTK